VARAAILVVAGNDEQRAALTRALAAAGWRDVSAAASVAEAVATVRGGRG